MRELEASIRLVMPNGWLAGVKLRVGLGLQVEFSWILTRPIRLLIGVIDSRLS